MSHWSTDWNSALPSAGWMTFQIIQHPFWSIDTKFRLRIVTVTLQTHHLSSSFWYPLAFMYPRICLHSYSMGIGWTLTCFCRSCPAWHFHLQDRNHASENCPVHPKKPHLFFFQEVTVWSIINVIAGVQQEKGISYILLAGSNLWLEWVGIAICTPMPIYTSWRTGPIIHFYCFLTKLLGESWLAAEMFTYEQTWVT